MVAQQELAETPRQDPTRSQENYSFGDHVEQEHVPVSIDRVRQGTDPNSLIPATTSVSANGRLTGLRRNQRRRQQRHTIETNRR